MSTLNVVDKQILGYLVRLNPVQKKEVLSAIRTIAGEQGEDTDFEREMVRRIADYEGGNVKTYSWEDSLAHAREAYKLSKAGK